MPVRAKPANQPRGGGVFDASEVNGEVRLAESYDGATDPTPDIDKIPTW